MSTKLSKQKSIRSFKLTNLFVWQEQWVIELALFNINGIPFSFSQALILAVKFSKRAVKQNKM